MKNTVLKIFIKGKPIKQGKYAEIDGKPCYFANMTKAKWFRNYTGYAIAKQILDELPRGTKIIYKRVDLNTHYITNKTRIYKKGILFVYGDHRQYCLPLKQWEAKAGMPAEPKDLPVDILSDWKHGEVDYERIRHQAGRLVELARKAGILAEKIPERTPQPQLDQSIGEDFKQSDCPKCGDEVRGEGLCYRCI